MISDMVTEISNTTALVHRLPHTQGKLSQLTFLCSREAQSLEQTLQATDA